MLKKHVFIFALVFSLQPSPALPQSGGSSMQRLLSGWFWLARINPQQNRIQLQSLLRLHEPPSYDSNSLQFRAIDFPGGSTAVGADIRRVSQLAWRLQSETTVLVRGSRDSSSYLVYETNFPAQYMELSSSPDLAQLAHCLYSTQATRAPIWLRDVHSFTGVLSELLGRSFRRGLQTTLQSSSVFTPSIVIGRDLLSHSIYRPGRQSLNHMIYSRYGSSEYPVQPHHAVHRSDDATMIEFAAAPHTGACSFFMSPMGIMSTTLDAMGNTIMLVSNEMVILFRWLTGMCKPNEECGNPATWDRDNHKGQVNSLPLHIPRQR